MAKRGSIPSRTSARLLREFASPLPKDNERYTAPAKGSARDTGYYKQMQHDAATYAATHPTLAAEAHREMAKTARRHSEHELAAHHEAEAAQHIRHATAHGTSSHLTPNDQHTARANAGVQHASKTTQPSASGKTKHDSKSGRFAPGKVT